MTYNLTWRRDNYEKTTRKNWSTYQKHEIVFNQMNKAFKSEYVESHNLSWDTVDVGLDSREESIGNLKLEKYTPPR